MSEEIEVSGRLGVVLELENTGSLTQLSFTLPADVTYDQYEAIGRGFGAVTEAMQWAIGDYLVQGESVFGAEAAQASEGLGISPASRQQFARVAERIPKERRVEGLSWSHHRAVVALDPDEQDLWLARALEGGWSKQDLEDHISEQAEPKTTKVREHERRQGIADAAEHVYRRAEKDETNETACVPWADMQALGDALGIVEVES